MSDQPNRRGTDPYARWCDRESPRGHTYVDFDSEGLSGIWRPAVSECVCVAGCQTVARVIVEAAGMALEVQEPIADAHGPVRRASQLQHQSYAVKCVVTGEINGVQSFGMLIAEGARGLVIEGVTLFVSVYACSFTLSLPQTSADSSGWTAPIPSSEQGALNLST